MFRNILRGEFIDPIKVILCTRYFFEGRKLNQYVNFDQCRSRLAIFQIFLPTARDLFLTLIPHYEKNTFLTSPFLDKIILIAARRRR